MKKFRALRLVALIWRVIAWIVLVLGIIGALVAIVLGAIVGRVGDPSPLLSQVPGVSNVVDPISGVVAGVAVLVVALLQFLLIYAASDVIHLALDLEQNTRETAFYLRGESTMPPPPAAIAWEPPETPDGQ